MRIAYVSGCSDNRLDAVFEKLRKFLGILRWDVVRIPAGSADVGWTLNTFKTLNTAHQPDTVILTAHQDCAAKGTLIDLQRTLYVMRLLAPLNDTIRAFWMYADEDPENPDNWKFREVSLDGIDLDSLRFE